MQDFLSASYFENDTYFTLNRRNLTVSQHFRPVVKMGPKPGKASLIVNRHLRLNNFSFQRDAYCHFEENILQ